jgi:hypothetical protein
MRKLALALALILISTPALARPTSYVNTHCVGGMRIVFSGPHISFVPC